MEITYCPVCGYGPFKEPYQTIEELRTSYEICDCCGCEYGNDDTEKHLETWKNNGYIWFNEKLKPNNWSFKLQSNNIIRPWPPNNT